MSKKPSKKTLKNKAWKAFSKFIRLRDSDKNGNCKCVTCGKIEHWEKMQAGHAIGGRTNSILFHEQIVHAQCKACNIFKNGNYIFYTLFMIDRYGRKKFEEFLELKNKNLRLTESDLMLIEAKYNAKSLKLQG